MTPEEIRDINEAMKEKGPWINIKHGGFYHVSEVRLCCTNDSDGLADVIYNSYDFNICGFTREYKEFMEKFRPAKICDYVKTDAIKT